MEERDERKTMMLQALAQMELQPLPAEEEVALTASKKLPLGKIASLGVAFEPIMDLVQSVMGPGAQSQLYKGAFGCVSQWQRLFRSCPRC